MTALLLAESEPAVRGFLERQLRNDGFDVVACERAEQLPRAADPDVLVLGDAEALDRGVVPDCPVIVLGGADPAARVRALARADDCLPRPFVYEELLAQISHNAKIRFRLHAGILCQFGRSVAPQKCPNDTWKKRKSVCAMIPGVRLPQNGRSETRLAPQNVKEAGFRLPASDSVRGVLPLGG
jgi:CheY-like chemotaxis protein